MRVGNLKTFHFEISKHGSHSGYAWIGLSLAAALISILVGSVGMRNAGKATIVSIIVCFIIIPIVTHMIYLNLEIYATILDWPVDMGSFLRLWQPFSVIVIASIFGGFLGMFAGRYWAEGDRSCLQCLMGPFILVMILSIVILVLP